MKNKSGILITFIFTSLLIPMVGWAAMPPLVQAERLFNEQLYEDALPLYFELTQHDPSPDIQWRLVQVHYELGHFAEVIELAKDSVPSDPTDKGYIEIIYLEALAHLNLSQLDQGRDRLVSYLSLGNEDSLAHYAEALFQLGTTDFSLDHPDQAKTSFTAVTQLRSPSKLAPQAQLYLGRIAFMEGNNKEAQDRFIALQSSLQKNDPLQLEISYWLGRLHLAAAEYSAAATQFQRAIAVDSEAKSDWFPDALYYLGGVYLKLTEGVNQTKEQQQKYFEKGENVWKQLALISPEERSFLSLGELYLSRARRLDDAKSYQASEEILAKQGLFVTPYGQAKALLMRADAAPSYEERDRLYRQLTQERNGTNPLYGDGWHMRGLNDFQEGQRLMQKGQLDETRKMFYQAADSLKQASLLLELSSPAKAEAAIKYQALALYHSQTQASKREALDLLDQLIRRPTVDNKGELYYLSGLVASHLYQDDHLSEFKPLAENSLKEGITQFPQGKFAPESQHLLALLYYNDGRQAESERLFLDLAEKFPESLLAGEAWYWAASCSESVGREDGIIKLYKRNAFEKYPNCRYAAEAYLSYYPYRDYLQGSRAPLKHLEAMPTQFSHSPLIINAHYLIGLDHKKDRLSLEGKPVRQKNLLAAIDAFQEAESAFDSMYEQNLIPPDQLTYFATLRYRSTLERALSNLAIAEESQGAKRDIYLEYAEEVFKKVVGDFTSMDNLLAQRLLQGEPYHRLWEESEFWLAHTYIQHGNDMEADKLLTQMIDRYRKAGVTKGYFLARTWMEKGLIARRSGDCEMALESFSLAEDASKGKVFSADQRLELWIQQSLCYKDLKQYDQSMRLLSQVINDDAISGMRLKAMFLRADLYELQGRPELALKQLEATAKKGGEWGQKAKAALDFMRRTDTLKKTKV